MEKKLFGFCIIHGEIMMYCKKNAIDFKSKVQNDFSWAIKHRRYLHQYPEISWNEKHTSQYCKNVMKDLGFEIVELSKHGFYADLKVDGAKKTIAWRAELDALAILERSTFSYKSKNDGAAHMCGHDMHMAVSMLGAKILSEHKSELNCNVRFLFQPAEENPPGGALDMIADGCLEGVDEIYGMHSDIMEDTGVVSTKVGPITASIGQFNLLLIGKGTHVGIGEMGLDLVRDASKLLQNWYRDIANIKNIVDPFVFYVTKFRCGDLLNVIPEEAEIGGTIRSYRTEDLAKIEEAMNRSFAPLEECGYKVRFDCGRRYDSIINSQEEVNKIFAAAREVVGDDKVKYLHEPKHFGEDFGNYLLERPGAFFFLGVRNMEKKIYAPQHSPRFDVDEDAIAIGTQILIELMMQM